MTHQMAYFGHMGGTAWQTIRALHMLCMKLNEDLLERGINDKGKSRHWIKKPQFTEISYSTSKILASVMLVKMVKVTLDKHLKMKFFQLIKWL